MKNIELYLDYVNNFLTITSFAEHYDMSLADAENVIKLGRKEHELKINGIKLTNALKTNNYRSFGNVFSKMLVNSIKDKKQ